MRWLARLLGLGKRSRLPTPHPEVAYVQWSCINDDCGLGRLLEGRVWLPGLEPASPHPGCQSQEVCQCLPVYVMRQEEGAIEIEQCLREP